MVVVILQGLPLEAEFSPSNQISLERKPFKPLDDPKNSIVPQPEMLAELYNLKICRSQKIPCS